MAEEQSLSVHDAIVRALEGKQARDMHTLYNELISNTDAKATKHTYSQREVDDGLSTLQRYGIIWSGAISDNYTVYDIVGLAHPLLKEHILYRSDREMAEKIDLVSDLGDIAPATVMRLAEDYYEELLCKTSNSVTRPALISALDVYSQSNVQLKKTTDEISPRGSTIDLNRLESYGVLYKYQTTNRLNQRTTRWALTSLGHSIVPFVHQTQTFRNKYMSPRSFLGQTREDAYGRNQTHKAARALYTMYRQSRPSKKEVLWHAGMLPIDEASKRLLDRLRQKAFVERKASDSPPYWDRDLSRVEIEERNNIIRAQPTLHLDLPPLTGCKYPQAVENVAKYIMRYGKASRRELLDQLPHRATEIDPSLDYLQDTGKIERDIPPGQFSEYWLTQNGSLAVTEYLRDLIEEAPQQLWKSMELEPIHWNGEE